MDQNAKWEPLSVERPENSDIKDSLHKMFYIKSAKKLQKKGQHSHCIVLLFVVPKSHLIDEAALGCALHP